MAEGFYQTNNEVLKFDLDKGLDKIRFNHYITKKENFQRLKCDLPRGQFYMTINQVSRDLNVTFAKAQRLIKEFEDKSIIKLIFQYEKWEKKPSIWEYLSAVKSDNQSDSKSDSQNDNQEYSEINDLNGIGDNQNDSQNDNQSDNPKKEYTKNKNKKQIYYTSDSKEYRLAEYLYNYILKNNAKAKKPSLQNWAKVFDYVLRIDKRDLEEVKELIKFSQQHKFWYKNILSPDKFRHQYDRLILEMNEERKNSSIVDLKKDKKEKPKKLLGWD
ncbi:hypothetical protein [Clostridium sp. OS1-26]|uniref:hypothetical protein n=1 Tax=Clostridium sp. OS1-26 TaxID=3070681 RepID=UPI0027DFA331|nr:hypothetical protein [Clostridium sp. OS1-26]WML35668.1 hypothetical protein RCG18_02635 [Clostridium sp. OS1-26]